MAEINVEAKKKTEDRSDVDPLQALERKISDLRTTYRTNVQKLRLELDKATTRLKLEITAQVGEIGRDITERRTKAVAFRDSELKQAAKDYEANLRAAQSLRDRTIKQIHQDFEAKRDELTSENNTRCTPLQLKLGAGLDKLAEDANDAIHKLSVELEEALAPLLREQAVHEKKAAELRAARAVTVQKEPASAS